MALFLFIMLNYFQNSILHYSYSYRIIFMHFYVRFLQVLVLFLPAGMN